MLAEPLALYCLCLLLPLYEYGLNFICQFGQWIKLQYIVSLPPDKLWWNSTVLISVGLGDGTWSHDLFSNITSSSQYVYGCGCGHEYIHLLFFYDNMGVTLSHGSPECLHVSPLLQLMLLTVQLLYTCPRHQHQLILAWWTLAGALNTKAGNLVVYYSLYEWRWEVKSR